VCPATRAQHYCEATFVRNGKLDRALTTASRNAGDSAHLIDDQVYTKM
jgi:hypothetical protein